MGIWKRGGRGSNQYTVKPSTRRDDDNAVSDRVAAMADRHGIPTSSERDYGSSDPELEASLRELAVHERNGDEVQASAIRQSISQSYPESFSRAVLSGDRNNPIYQDSVGDDDIEVDEMTEILDDPQWQGDEQADDVDIAEHQRQSRMTSLIMVSRKDPSSMSLHFEDIQDERAKMSRERVQNMAF